MTPGVRRALPRLIIAAGLWCYVISRSRTGTSTPWPSVASAIRWRSGRTMTSAASEMDESPEWVQVLKWRAGQLESAGYNAAQAGALAAMRDVDLHEAIDLLKAGAPADIAFDVLSD